MQSQALEQEAQEAKKRAAAAVSELAIAEAERLALLDELNEVETEGGRQRRADKLRLSSAESEVYSLHMQLEEAFQSANAMEEAAVLPNPDFNAMVLALEASEAKVGHEPLRIQKKQEELECGGGRAITVTPLPPPSS
jgi:hypothetical protein